ncbi:EAL domain-containing protein [Zoogloea sp.]|uniref:putative bifunctional diguanylate cyclase/phosphodiesterase n=1 Tax=Zoogloea sp. TaxID=49181 RepID=UPI001AC57686|nr:EAL domain-containing protein [Zoogloea sp.]MBN8284224.1 EAL domain-containing protein [Zoogloea sp.]
MLIPWKGQPFPPEGQRRATAEALVRILVIDDEPSLARSITALLQADDRLIEECGTVAEALARLNAAAYDLIVLDYRLPDASGLAVMDWLLSHDRRESVIMISAEQSVEAAVGALRRGAADFLIKPYSAEQLRRSVAKTLAKRQTERSRRQTRQRLESSEQMHRYLVENSLDLIYTLDADGRFSYLNQRIESLLGHPRSALLGKHFSEIVYPEDLERARFSFNERRTGPRATSNLALRLTRNPFGNVESDEHGPVSIVLNAMGIYNRTDSRAAIHYAGTYGAARSLPGYRLHEQGHGDHCFHDPLTHLPNRDLFCDRLNLSIAQAKRRKTHIAVMFIDMDRFKLVNDTYGQGEGDTLLRAVATRLRQCLRKGDSLTRHGSDEFLVLLPDVGTKADATAIADKILQAFRNPFPVVDGEFTATISLGAALHPEDGDSADDLIQHASVAMHQVKGSGGNAFSFFSPDMHATYRARISLEKELHLALGRKELELHYQPLISLSRGAITGMEALVRWRHPVHGVVAPSRFIQMAEEAGIIHEITRWVLDTACAQFSSWRRRYPNLRLSTNLSARDFDHSDLDDVVSRVLARYGLPADSLEVEITERLLLEQDDKVSRRMQSLRELGIGIAIDDFGTGYSSLAYLRRCGVTRLKIDRSFVRNIKSTEDHPIVSAIAGIARGFDIRLAAEGVERDDQMNALETLGCDEMQGFLFSRPISAEDATRILQDFRLPGAVPPPAPALTP